MKIKESKWFIPSIILISTLVETTVIDVLVWEYTKRNKTEDEHVIQYANEDQGNALYYRLLSMAEEFVHDDYPTYSVDELISIGYKDESLLFTAIASGENSKIALLKMDTTCTEIDETLKFLANTDPTNPPVFMVTVKYYSLEDMSNEMQTSYKDVCNIKTNKYRAAYGKTLDSNHEGNFFASYPSESYYYSVTGASFNSEEYLDLSSSIRVSATPTMNSYLYWLLFKMCA